jgi:hypothetical protein
MVRSWKEKMMLHVMMQEEESPEVLPLYHREISLPLLFNFYCMNSDVSNLKLKLLIF